MSTLFSHSRNSDLEDFLARHWQRAHRVFRRAFTNWNDPLDKGRLRRLAELDAVESRLVTTTRSPAGPAEGCDGPSKFVSSTERDFWSLSHGPFSSRQWTELPDRDWTLLVQDVDKIVPDVASLLEGLSFLPDWRIDDVMVSYARPGGSVGPHWDEYDVFLVQGSGRRRWQLQYPPNDGWQQREDCELRLIKGFKPDYEVILEPGDVLYLPPGVGHFGVAMDECMSFSLGMRAPSVNELLPGLAGRLLNYPDRRLADAGRNPVDRHRFFIYHGDWQRLQAMLKDLVNSEEWDRALLAQLSELKPGLEEWLGPETDVEALDADSAIRACSVFRPVFKCLRSGQVLMALDGELHEIHTDFAEALEALAMGGVIRYRTLDRLAGCADASYWLLQLFRDGWLLVADDE